MKLELQKQTLPIVNHDRSSLTRQYQKHSSLLPGGCKRGLIVGGSGCGKTNVMISLLEHSNGLRFENVYVYSKSLQQPKYQYLNNLLKPMKDVGYFEFEDGDDILPPNSARINSVVIFDDVVCDSQTIIRDYF